MLQAQIEMGKPLVVFVNGSVDKSSQRTLGPYLRWFLHKFSYYQPSAVTGAYYYIVSPLCGLFPWSGLPLVLSTSCPVCLPLVRCSPCPICHLPAVRPSSPCLPLSDLPPVWSSPCVVFPLSRLPLSCPVLYCG